MLRSKHPDTESSPTSLSGIWTPMSIWDWYFRVVGRPSVCVTTKIYYALPKLFFEKNKRVASICHGTEILAAADVIHGLPVTTVPRSQLDVEFIGATYVAELLVISGNLYCCRFKKECFAWTKAFAATLLKQTR